MTDAALDELSLFSLAAILVRSRWRIARWAFAFAVLAALSVIGKPPVYKASASFIPEGGGGSSSNLASIAGQFGIAIPRSNESLTPEFYSALVKAPVLLRRIANGTFTVAEMNNRRLPLFELLKAEGRNPLMRTEDAVRKLQSMIMVSTDKATGVIEATVTTPWPSVSFGIAQAVLSGVNDFNLNTRQSQARAERKFIEGRLAVARDDLNTDEARLAAFIKTNRNYLGSPDLGIEHDRLQRALTIDQGVYTSLTQAYEEARLREVRDTPMITVFEPPVLPTQPQPRGRVIRVVIGLVLGAVIGALIAWMSALMARRRQRGDEEVAEFLGSLAEVRAFSIGHLRRIGERAGR